jgi:ribosomal protein L7/L12
MPSLLTRLLAAILKGVLWSLEKAFRITRKKPVPPFPYNERMNTITLSSDVEKELRRLVSTGNKVEAIKRVTELTGAGLRVSKDYVDGLARRQGRRR